MASPPIDAMRQPSRPAFWRDPAVRGIAYQILFVAIVVAVGWFLVHNTLVNLGRQNIATGFGFLHREASFAIGESLIRYAPSDTYARAFFVGLINTLYVAILGIVLATILGTLIGIARLSRNWLVAKLSQVYVETFRNIPLALQLLFWWSLLRAGAPAPRQAWQPVPGFFVSNRGVQFPVPVSNPAHLWIVLAFIIGDRRRCGRQPLGEAAADGDRRANPVGLARRRADCRAAIAGFSRVRCAVGVGSAGAQGLQLCRRWRGFAGIRGIAARADDLYRKLYRGDRARRHPVGELGPKRGGGGARPQTRTDDAVDRLAASAAGHHPACDQPISQSDQEQLAWP